MDNTKQQLLLCVFIICIVCGVCGATFVHPGMPLTVSDLDDIKAKIDTEINPWSSAYAGLAAYTSPDYAMQGPFVEVGRTSNINNGA